MSKFVSAIFSTFGIFFVSCDFDRYCCETGIEELTAITYGANIIYVD